MNRIRKTVSIFLSCCLLLALLPVQAFSLEETETVMPTVAEAETEPAAETVAEAETELVMETVAETEPAVEAAEETLPVEPIAVETVQAEMKVEEVEVEEVTFERVRGLF